MRRHGIWVLVALGVTLVGCADRHSDAASDAHWACREIDGTHGIGGADSAGTAMTALVLWPILAGACLASRS